MENENPNFTTQKINRITFGKIILWITKFSSKILIRFAGFVLLNLFRLFLLVLGKLIPWTIELLEYGLLGLEFIGPKVSINFEYFEHAEKEFENVAKFTEGELYEMAQKIIDKGMTIKEISNHYGISDRQSIKIKKIIDSPIKIHAPRKLA